MQVLKDKKRLAKRKARKPARRARYHHGNLREALIEATLRLIEEDGADNVTVRAAARRAGVSSGAPFRHFPSRAALMAAAAEEAQRRFRAEIAAAFDKVKSDNPLARLRALGHAYIRWAIGNPTYFRIISSGNLFNFDDSLAVSQDNDEIIGMTRGLIAQARRRGMLQTGDLRLIQLAGRALVYGLCRMYIDGHLPRWGVAEKEVGEISQEAFNLFIAGISRIKQADVKSE